MVVMLSIVINNFDNLRLETFINIKEDTNEKIPNTKINNPI